MVLFRIILPALALAGSAYGAGECDGESNVCFIKVGFFGEGGFGGMQTYDSVNGGTSIAALPACDTNSIKAYQDDWVEKINSLNGGKGIGIKSGHSAEKYFFKVQHLFRTFPTGKYNQASPEECTQLCRRWGVSDYRGLKYGKNVNFYQDEIPARYQNKYMFDAQDYNSVKASYGESCSGTPGAQEYANLIPAFEISDLSHLGHTDPAIFFGTRGNAESVNQELHCADGASGSHNACKWHGRLELKFTAHENTTVVFGAQVYADGGQDDSFYIDVDHPEYAEGRKWNNKGMVTEGGEWGLMPLERGAPPTQRVNGDTTPFRGVSCDQGAPYAVREDARGRRMDP